MCNIKFLQTPTTDASMLTRKNSEHPYIIIISSDNKYKCYIDVEKRLLPVRGV